MLMREGSKSLTHCNSRKLTRYPSRRVTHYSPYPPVSIRRMLARSLEKYDQICDTIETRIVGFFDHILTGVYSSPATLYRRLTA